MNLSKMRSVAEDVCVLLVCMGAVLCAMPASAQPRQPSKLTVASYNVENFFDVFDDPYTDDDGTEVKPRPLIEAIANTLKAIDADVVCIQEVENEPALQAMVNELMPDRGYRFVTVLKGNDGRGINLGIISRLPIISVTSHRWLTLTNPAAPNRTWSFSRDLMRIDLDLGNDQTLTVYNVHLKSNRDSEGDPNSSFHRTAEAIALKTQVLNQLEQNSDALILAMGDFNSDYQQQPNDPRTWPAMEHLLMPVDGRRVLIDLHAGLTRQERITLPGSGRYPPITFDYILASPKMAGRVIKNSARVFDGSTAALGSDHLPVVATFVLE